MRRVVDRVTTATTLPALLGALAREYAAGFEGGGSAWPSPSLLAAVVGLVGAETSLRSINNWNLGNVSEGENYDGDVWAHPDPQPGQPAFFRSYDSLDAGARDLWRVLKADRYKAAITLARNADFAGFGRELSRSGYVAGLTPEQTETYARNVVEWATRARVELGTRGQSALWIAGALGVLGWGGALLLNRGFAGLLRNRDARAVLASSLLGAAALAPLGFVQTKKKIQTDVDALVDAELRRYFGGAK